MRPSNRKPEETRIIKFEHQYTKHAEGSVLASFGETKVLCNASVEEGAPPFMRKIDSGWLTAEYRMLPRSTHTRIKSNNSYMPNGRAMEIQRLIGRSLRASINLLEIPNLTITIDCDVIQADGGTRTAAISGGYIALKDAIEYLLQTKKIEKSPITRKIAAISVGIYQNTPVVDLDYEEDYQADTDMNIVMDQDFGIIEIQGTAEHNILSRHQLNKMLTLAEEATQKIIQLQNDSN